MCGRFDQYAPIDMASDAAMPKRPTQQTNMPIPNVKSKQLSGPGVQFKAALMEHLAGRSRKSGALWSGHSSLYMSQRLSLAQLMEEDCGIGIPVMQPGADDLEFYAQVNDFEVTFVDERSNACRLRGKRGTGAFGIDQLWVKVSSTSYREAMLKVWGKELHEANRVRHEAAAQVLSDCSRGVAQSDLRRRLSNAARGKLVAEFNFHADAHLAAAEGNGTSDLMKHFDCTINADHVYSKAALRTQPDAYVLLFPVPADANQGYGRVVEKYYQSRREDGAALYLSPGMAFKLLSGTMPKISQDVDPILRQVLCQISGNSVGTQTWRNSMMSFGEWLKVRLADA